jgi:dolichol kinase
MMMTYKRFALISFLILFFGIIISRSLPINIFVSLLAFLITMGLLYSVMLIIPFYFRRRINLFNKYYTWIENDGKFGNKS